MRALIIASASLETVMAPSSTCETNSFTRFRPRSLADGSRAIRPSSTIRSRRLPSNVCSVATAAPPFFDSGMRLLLLGIDFRLQFVQRLGITDRLAEHLFQLVVALQTAAQ